MTFIVSEKSAPNGMILVITDKEIMGKVFEEGKKVLDMSAKFYLGEEKSVGEVLAMAENAYIFHLTGIKAVGLGLKEKWIEKGKVLVVKGIPHAEVVKDNK